jgi:two-component system phosphate regulon sensor histidine kinase PhoR
VARATQDVVGFRRIFVLFCTLVLLPAMLLSGFGIVAIDNERSALKQRQREEAVAVLQRTEAALVEQLQRTTQAMAALPVDRVLPQVPRLRERGLPIGPVLVAPLSGEPALSDGAFEADGRAFTLARARETAVDIPVGEFGHVALTHEGTAGLMLVYRPGPDQLAAFLVDDGALRRSVERPLDEEQTLWMRIIDSPAATNPLELWMHNTVRPQHAGENLIAEERLRPPFDRYSVYITGPEPSGTTIVIYIVLLALFYVLLITGVVMTSRLIWQEARLSRLKTDFVSHVSHELRTPLTSIRLFIETLRLGRASSVEEQEECLELLTRETERLSDMIERVLGYARLKSGRRIFALSPVSPRALCDDAVDAFRAQIVGPESKKHPEQRLELEVDVPDDLPHVSVDREAVVEALLNLLGNAWKYTGEHKRIRLFARLLRRRVLIGVEDNGPGLPKAEHKRVFDRFYQAGAGLLARSTEGSGLGLAITKSIIDGHRGRIYVESEEGHGATFCVELRLAKEQTAREPAAEPAEAT